MYQEDIQTPLGKIAQNQHFEKQSVAFQTIKSVGIGGLFGAAIGYGTIKVLKGIMTGEWALKPTGFDLGLTGILASIVGLNRGFDTNKSTQISNHRADFFNKYENKPDIQNEIVLNVGGPDFTYQKNQSEKILSKISDFSWYGFIFADLVTDNKKFTNILGSTTALSWVGSMISHVIGMEQASKKDQQKLNHVEKLALEKYSGKQDEIAL
jgi:hypothetical protein